MLEPSIFSPLLARSLRCRFLLRLSRLVHSFPMHYLPMHNSR